jgi:hypothetical protein
MSATESAAIKIQSLVRGFLCRRQLTRKSRCIEFRLKNFFPRSKPPVYRKKSKLRPRFSLERHAILIQKHIRGYLQRKKYRDMIIDKMLKEQEDRFRRQIEEIEKEMNIYEEVPESESKKPQKDSNLYLELPLQVPQKRSPSKHKKLHRSVLYEYDYFILSAIEIQRVFRGYLARKQFGNFKILRRKIIRIQRIYRNWRVKKEGQLELAAALMNKQCSMLATSYSSYQHLKSLILTQDRQGKFVKFINYCEEKLVDAGLNTSATVNRFLQNRVKELEQERIETENYYKVLLQGYKHRYKAAISEYLKGLKTVKFNMELAQKTNSEQISRLFRSLEGVSKDLDSESFCENSTFLPDMSFIDRSSINIIP